MMKYAIYMGLIAIVTSGCTGPMGLVLGGERVHELYNQRFQSQYAEGFGEPMDYHKPSERASLQAELQRRKY